MFDEISIRPSKDIRNNYAEISKLAKDHPVAITVNGREDTVLMSHEQFMQQQRLLAQFQERKAFFDILSKSGDDIKNGKVQTLAEVRNELHDELSRAKK